MCSWSYLRCPPPPPRVCRGGAARGVAAAAKRVVALEPMIGGLAFVRTADLLSDRDGLELASWQHGYVLSETAAGIRIVMAMPEQELDCWQLLGTPLGAW